MPKLYWLSESEFARLQPLLPQAWHLTLACDQL
jgi:hypothetical protein